mmetsp:Transcript_2029/g.7063  ORF Transcript_2029/g.7063 Transcript_2029/m.7063 type:complete len:359 (+) Transcript_2029:534-1610(+)
MTALPRSTAPAPPRAQWLETVAAKAPAPMACARTSSSSAGVSVANWLMATTTRTPNLFMLRTCTWRLAQPASRSSRFSSRYGRGICVPALMAGAPGAWLLSARTVATTTAHCGTFPLERHLMLKNFSAPMSAPKPASVTQKPSGPASLSASWSATMDELPWAMLAKGPACTNTGVCSTVCMSVGMMASFMSTVSAPPQPRSSAVTGSPARERPTTMRPSRSRMSASDVVSASTAMTSEATVMSKPVSRVRPFSVGPCPTVTPRRWRSQTSSTRFHVTVSGSMSRRAKRLRSSSVSSAGSVLSMPSLARRLSITGANLRSPDLDTGTRRSKSCWSVWPCSWNMRVSMAAARRLLAAVTA